MYSFKYGGKQGTTVTLEVADDLVAVRTYDPGDVMSAVTRPESRSVLSQFIPVVEFAEANVSVLRSLAGRAQAVQLRDRTRHTLKQERSIRFVGRALCEAGTGIPVVYTENFFVKFRDELDAAACEQILAEHTLTIKRPLSYAGNAFFVQAPDGSGLDVFRIAAELLDEAEVELAHPEIIRQTKRRQIAPQQWHLHQVVVGGQPVDAHVNVIPAWEMSRGRGTTIAIIDDGVDVNHPEFRDPGKVVAPRDVTLKKNDARPRSRHDNHGTPCAGVACAAGHQAWGVAPEARLMPIRNASSLGSQAEADAFAWAADNGADVISCSWGPADGDWFNPNDARHHQVVPLPDSTRLAIDYALRTGRRGKGCVICWAAGNGNESVDNDGYASYEPVIAVAASNDRGTRSVYSDFGSAIWCTFPSNDFVYPHFGHPAPLTPGIWTTDRAGSQGYNPGILNPFADKPPGDDHGDYTNDFGGTSSACPGVAGIAALILSANPELDWQQVKDIIRQSCAQIDGDSGSYNEDGHSPLYGYGKPDAARAVALARARATQEALQLQLRAEVQGRLEAKGVEKVFRIRLQGKAHIELSGPAGCDFDLYVRRGEPPTTTTYDARAYTTAPRETLTIEAEPAGEYYILVHSHAGSGDFRLSITAP